MYYSGTSFDAFWEMVDRVTSFIGSERSSAAVSSSSVARKAGVSDANGNRYTKTGGYNYYYDHENWLVKVVQSGSTLQTNVYDGDGMREQKTEGTTATDFIYQGLQLIYENNHAPANPVTRHYYANGLQVGTGPPGASIISTRTRWETTG